MVNHTLPLAWWLWWFGAATAVYAVLAVWFWNQARRADADSRETGADTNSHDD